MSRSRRSALLLMGLVAGVAGSRFALRADTLTLKDGTVLEGRIIERTTEYVKFEVKSPGISQATLQFDWKKDVASFLESPPEAAQLLAEYNQKLASAEQANTAAAFLEVGRWACGDNVRLYHKAIEAYEQALRQAPEQEASIGLLTAKAQRVGGNFRAAWTTLKRLTEKYPDDSPASAELARLDEQIQGDIDQQVQKGLDAYRKGQVRQAIQLFERLGRLELPNWQAKAESAAARLADMSFAGLLADARLHQPCPVCVGRQAGLAPCPTCCRGPIPPAVATPGRIVKPRMVTEIVSDPKAGIERRRTFQVEDATICPTCHGFASVLCPECRGAGVDLGVVGPIERADVIDGLKTRLDWLHDRRLSPYVDDPAGLHPANLESVHLAACRYRYYVAQLDLLAPRPAGKELAQLVDRRTRVENLFRHTANLYAARDIDSYHKTLQELLKEKIHKEGWLLWPEDNDYREPTPLTGSTAPAGRK